MLLYNVLLIVGNSFELHHTVQQKYNSNEIGTIDILNIQRFLMTAHKENIEIQGKQNRCFPKEQSLKVFCYI